ncbi:MAG: trifunctional histidinol dehydrogenase [Thelocarpon superellum]|nr:MAG: trifunctional histidinol dehydrogenase [Thelocarpon superellum]
MTFPFVPAVGDIRQLVRTDQLYRPSLSYLQYLGSVFAAVTTDEVADTLGSVEALRKSFGARLNVLLDVTALSETGQVVQILDVGVSKAIVSKTQLRELQDHANIASDRLVLRVLEADLHTTSTITGETTGGYHVPNLSEPISVAEWIRKNGHGPLYVSLPQEGLTSPVETYTALLAATAIPVIPASILSVTKAKGAEELPISSFLPIRSDRPDGLFPTLVADERGVALGLVYSTNESIQESLRTGRGVYHSRHRGLWYKGESSGDIQELVKLELDCDADCLKFTVRQRGRGFCHLATATCFGDYQGLSRLEKTLQSRKSSAPTGSYTARLFSSPELLHAKIMEEAEELCSAKTREDVAFEAADLLYFALSKCVSTGVTLEEVERNLDNKSLKVSRRKGDAKGPWAKTEGLANGSARKEAKKEPKEATSTPATKGAPSDEGKERIRMTRYVTSSTTTAVVHEALQRPSQRSTDAIMDIVKPIIKAIQERGDAALLEYTHKFENATSLTSPVIRAPFPASLMQISDETKDAIDVSFENIRKFHAAQKETKPLVVETMPGVSCSRFARPIERVGLYVPGGTAVLPSTALMLGVPAQVAGCQKIVMASPPRADGSITPEIVYVAHKVGAESIVLAGGAQAVAAMAYGTESVSKVDKILGPGNQFVTAGKMVVSNDTSAGVSIDMPAGPSEVMVIADATARPAFVASDLLSQAEHGVDSQVVLIAVDLTEAQLAAIEDELDRQANALPRVDIVRGAIKHSVTLVVTDIDEAMRLSNAYAPEHLILQVAQAAEVLHMVENAGSVFVGPWTPESVGDYSAGVNHSLPTYGYARQYSGVNLASYIKHITSSTLTEEGLRNVGGAVMQLARVEELEAHRRAVDVRLRFLDAAGATETAGRE